MGRIFLTLLVLCACLLVIITVGGAGENACSQGVEYGCEVAADPVDATIWDPIFKWLESP